MDGFWTCRSEQIDSNRPSQASPPPSTPRRPPPSAEPSPSAVHFHPPPRPAEASNASTAAVRPPPSPEPSVIHLTPDRPLLRLPTGTNHQIIKSRKDAQKALHLKCLVSLGCTALCEPCHTLLRKPQTEPWNLRTFDLC